MSATPEFAVLEVPARIANLSFRMEAPREWTLHALPGEDVDFSEPGAFFPLVVLTAPGEAVALTVAARPGFESGTLQDWSLYLLDSQGIRPAAFGPAAIGNVQGLAGVGRQEQEGTWLEIRFAFFEDGGRLVHLGLLAPEGAGGPLDAVWEKALESFDLAAPQGPTVPVGPGMGICPEPVVAEVVKEAAEAPGLTGSDLGFYAKADNLATLDPEHPDNVRLRVQGVGLVPNVLKRIGDDRRIGAEDAHLRSGHRHVHRSFSLGQVEVVTVKLHPFDQMPARLRFKAGQVTRAQFDVRIPVSGSDAVQ